MAYPRLVALYSEMPRAGKSTIAAYLAKYHTYKRRHFAQPIRDMLAALLSSAGYTNTCIREVLYDAKDEPLSLIPGAPTSRFLLQTLGTEWGRTYIHPELWSLIATKNLFVSRRSRPVVFDDMRFLNEATAIRLRGGITIHLSRLDYTADGDGGDPKHASNKGLEDWRFDLDLSVCDGDSHLRDAARQISQTAPHKEPHP